MMTCLEFRRRVGAEPAAADEDVVAHRRDCPACARYQDELRAMDGLIERALKVSLPAKPQALVEAPARRIAPAATCDRGEPRRGHRRRDRAARFRAARLDRARGHRARQARDRHDGHDGAAHARGPRRGAGPGRHAAAAGCRRRDLRRALHLRRARGAAPRRAHAERPGHRADAAASHDLEAIPHRRTGIRGRRDARAERQHRHRRAGRCRTSTRSRRKSSTRWTGAVRAALHGRRARNALHATRAELPRPAIHSPASTATRVRPEPPSASTACSTGRS